MSHSAINIECADLQQSGLRTDPENSEGISLQLYKSSIRHTMILVNTPLKSPSGAEKPHCLLKSSHTPNIQRNQGGLQSYIFNIAIALEAGIFCCNSKYQSHLTTYHRHYCTGIPFPASIPCTDCSQFKEQAV